MSNISFRKMPSGMQVRGMKDEQVMAAVQAAINSLRRERPQLECEIVHERTTAHRLAVHMEPHFPGWNVDCEYDRDASLKKFLDGIRHLKFGVDLRDYRWSSFTKGNSAGAYNFSSGLTSTSNWTNGPAFNAAPPPFGYDYAQFLLGLPTTATYDNNSANTVGSKYQALYLQDDWRARPNLTINLGIRFEHETPATERYNRAVNGFNPVQFNPAALAGMRPSRARYWRGNHESGF